MENAYPDANPCPNPNLIPKCNPNLNSDCNINPNPNCNSVSTRALESLFDAFLNTNDLASPSGLVSFVLEEVLRRQSSDAEKVALLRNSREFGLHLLDSANRLWRQHDTFSNSIIWPLSHDLSIKVFSLLDIRSLCQAASSCSLFKKIAMEPACYRNIDLTYCKVDNVTVAKIIQNAGQYLRLLKLGLPIPEAEVDKNLRKMLRDSWTSKILLSSSCLDPLMACNGAIGASLQTLHLHNLPELDSRHLCRAIAVCKGLLDLEMVGLDVDVNKVIDSLTSCCHNLTRLSIQYPKSENMNRHSSCIRSTSCVKIVHGCPIISSLILRGFKFSDQKVRLIIKGLHHLLGVDFSGADFLTGSFLRELVASQEQKLESLILRGCYNLREIEVERLLAALTAGECKSLQHLDVCNGVGLVSTAPRSVRSNEPELVSYLRRSKLKEEILLTVRKERPKLDLRADFEEEKSPSECDSMSLTSSFGYNEYSEHLQRNFLSEDNLSQEIDSNLSSNSSESNQDSYFDEFDLDTESNYQDEDVDEEEDDDDSKFLSPYDYSEGEENVFMDDDDDIEDDDDDDDDNDNDMDDGDDNDMVDGDDDDIDDSFFY